MSTSAEAPTVLKAENVSKEFDGVRIIEDINIELRQGELVCLLGQSGVGKSTLFNVLSGLYVPETGSVEMQGEDITGKPGKISYMLQKDLLLPYKTVLDNAALPLIIKKTHSKKEAREAASALFEKFGLEGCQKKYPSQLSGGMRQRAALLRTYLSSQGAALLDEPFSALDTLTKSAMHKWYLEIMEQIELSTLFITHDIDEAVILSDRIYIMKGKPGRITEEIKIDTPKPRSPDFNLSEEFLKYKRQIVAAL
ncbi:MAG: ABC transporter ATP-binding protein [Clostridiales bacterium]|nr:ABC transporter ATP-binding protein [Clostridiales bacterium]